MRQAFYVKGDEEGTLTWWPGKSNECWLHNCKIYSWKSYEDEYCQEYFQDIKVEELSQTFRMMTMTCLVGAFILSFLGK